jgi:hypothetical protein
MQTTAEPMVTLTKQLVVNTGGLPNVVFSRQDKNVNVTAIVSREESGTLHFRLPPITIKSPSAGQEPLTWFVSWNYQPDSSLTGEPDQQYEIEIPATAQMTGAGITVVRQSPNDFLITVPPGMSLTSFSYDVVVPSDHEVDDPTIVVAPEPVG